MSSSNEVPVRGILLTHGAMADGIVDAVRRITGVGEDALEPLSNRGVSPEMLAEDIRARLGSSPTILFTDLQSGSCGFAAHRVSRDHEDMVVISGVNLPMLLEFVMNRQLPLQELVPRLLARGRAAIGCAPAELADDADRSPAR
jgi:fructoselysine/glucoselysine PTS system EIIA component